MPKTPKTRKTSAGIDKDAIRELAGLLDETGLSEIEVESAGMRIRVARNLVAATNAPAPVSPAVTTSGPAEPARAHASAPVIANAVTSPMVGTAYRSPSPEASPFVEVGSRVTKGQTVLIVEAMKTMNQITAPHDGKVTQIMVENNQPVEFGEPLLVIE